MGSSSQPRDSLVGQLVGVHIAMLALATVTVVGRIAVRLFLTKGGFGSDDITIVLSLFLAIAFVAINLYQMNFGLGQHVANLPPTTDFEESQELFYFGEMVYYVNVGTTKIAMLTLYLRIIPSKTYRYVIFGLMLFISLTVFSSVMANIFQCTPISYAWNKKQSGSCINQVALYFSNAGLDIFQDLLIYVLPIRVLYQLHLPRKQRIALIAIFVVGGFVCITGILRLNSLKTAAVTPDPTYENVASANWSVVEICVGIFCASLPHFRPLVTRFAPSWLDITKGSSTPSTSQNRSRAPPPRSGYIRQDHTIEIEMESQTDSVRRLRE